MGTSERGLPAELVEAGVLGGALAEEALIEQAAGQGFARRIADRLGGGQESWEGARVEDGTLVFVRRRGEPRDRYRLDPQVAHLRSPRLTAAVAGLEGALDQPATLERKGAESQIAGPLASSESLLAFGRKGLTIQR